MTLFNRIRTLTFSALTAALLVAPACDDGADYEALGVSVEDLEAMSADEVDALDRELAELDLGYDRLVTHDPHERPEFARELAAPLVFTHGERPDFLTALGNRPRPTHTGVDTAPASTALAGESDEPGCDTHGPEIELSAR